MSDVISYFASFFTGTMLQYDFKDSFLYLKFS